MLWDALLVTRRATLSFKATLSDADTHDPAFILYSQPAPERESGDVLSMPVTWMLVEPMTVESATPVLSVKAKAAGVVGNRKV